MAVTGIADRWVLISAFVSGLAVIMWALLPVGAAHADEVPPGTGCCFSFDKSPVTLVFCMTADACRIGAKP